MSAVRTAASFVCSDRSRTPGAVRHEAKRALLNALGAAAAAVQDPLITLLSSWAGGRRGTVPAVKLLWRPDATEEEHAALIGAAMMHVLDFDDTHRATFCHPTPIVAAVVMAEAYVLGSNGSACLDALLVGMEVELAFAEALFPSHYLRGNHITPTTGCIGAAAASAFLRGLDEEQTAHALSLAMSTSSGLIEMLGTMGNAYAVGCSARDGLVAAQLAQLGVEGVATAFEGDKGLMRASSDEPPERAGLAVGELGQRWRITENSYKRFSTETITQAPLECTLAVRRRTPEQKRHLLRRITLLAKPIVRDVVEQRARKFGPTPTNALQAKFDIRYCVAAMWVSGQWGPEQLTDAAIRDPEVLAVRQVVEVVSRPDHLGNDVRCTFEFADGSVDEEYVKAFKGSADNPMDDAELEDKLATAAGAALPPGQLRRILDLLWRLEDLTDARELFDQLVLNTPTAVLDTPTGRAGP